MPIEYALIVLACAAVGLLLPKCVVEINADAAEQPIVATFQRIAVVLSLPMAAMLTLWMIS